MDIPTLCIKVCERSGIKTDRYRNLLYNFKSEHLTTSVNKLLVPSGNDCS